MFQLTIIELTKIFKKWRSYLGYLGIWAIVSIVQTNLYFYGDNYVESLTKGLRESFFISGNLLNGYLIGHLILTALFILFPLTIVLVAGEILAGEATGGTYRLIISRPVSRLQILISKFFAGSIYTLSILIWMLVVSLLISLVIFGTGELIVVNDGLNIFARDDVLWRFGLGYSHIFFSMTVVFSITFLFSSFVENAIGPMIATMSILIVFVIISQLPLDIAQQLKPYLFTNYMMDWKLFFMYDINWNTQLRSLAVLGAHSVVFFLLTIIIFLKKDILT